MVDEFNCISIFIRISKKPINKLLIKRQARPFLLEVDCRSTAKPQTAYKNLKTKCCVIARRPFALID